MFAADQARRDALREVSIADLRRSVGADDQGDALSRIGRWLHAT